MSKGHADRRARRQPPAAPAPARHPPELTRYLHQRTGGMIGSLLWLIRSAATQAVIDGTEQITRKAMDSLQVDIASQATRSPGRP